jgi:hypothetical protein
MVQQTTFEHGDAGMSAHENGKRDVNGDTNAPKLPCERQKMSPFEISARDRCFSRCCAAFPKGNKNKLHRLENLQPEKPSGSKAQKEKHLKKLHQYLSPRTSQRRRIGAAV